jgi:hypothetical protein
MVAWSQFLQMDVVCRGAMAEWPQFLPADAAYKEAMAGWLQSLLAVVDYRDQTGGWSRFTPGSGVFRMRMVECATSNLARDVFLNVKSKGKRRRLQSARRRRQDFPNVVGKLESNWKAT